MPRRNISAAGNHKHIPEYTFHWKNKHWIRATSVFAHVLQSEIFVRNYPLDGSTAAFINCIHSDFPIVWAKSYSKSPKNLKGLQIRHSRLIYPVIFEEDHLYVLSCINDSWDSCPFDSQTDGEYVSLIHSTYIYALCSLFYPLTHLMRKYLLVLFLTAASRSLFRYQEPSMVSPVLPKCLFRLILLQQL